MNAMPRLAVIGFGAMAKALIRILSEHAPAIAVGAALMPKHESPPCGLHVVQTVRQLIDWRPTLVVECAGHSAIHDHLPALLGAGIPVVVASVGALADPSLRDRLAEASERGGGRVILPSGAIGGVDVLRAAGEHGLTSVTYTGRKPPLAWLGTPAESFDLDHLRVPTQIFEGSASEAARLYPKNANVTATIALAGLGFERTAVRLFADPTIAQNEHEIEASGAFGTFCITLRNVPLSDNPKTSLLAALSLGDAVRRETRLRPF